MGRVGATVPADSAVSEVVRLLDEYEADLDPTAASTEWVRAGAERARERVRAGHLDGAAWIGPKDEAVGLAWWEVPADAGRRAAIVLAREYRSGGALASFVTALDAAGPLRSVSGPILGVPDRDASRVLDRLGFRAIARTDMIFPDASPTPALRETAGPAERPLRTDDRARIAGLLERAYSDTPVDRWLFAQSTDPRADAEAASWDLLGTGVGRWVADASFGVEVDGRLVAATLVNEFHGALLSEVMVEPASRRRGYARRLVTRSIAAARALGLGTLRLVVTVGNDRAEPLYRSVGFVPTPVSGTVWLRLPGTGSAESEGSSD